MQLLPLAQIVAATLALRSLLVQFFPLTQVPPKTWSFVLGDSTPEKIVAVV